MNKFPRVLDSKTKVAKIAHISYAYNNRNLLMLLLKRGSLMINCKFDGLLENEKKINQLINNQIHELKRPVMAFVTFETQEGSERCLRYARKGSLDGKSNDKMSGSHLISILDENIGINIPSEPTDVLWENLSIGNAQKRKNKCLAYSQMILLLCVILSLFTYMRQKVVSSQQMYPPTRQCTEIDKVYNMN